MQAGQWTAGQTYTANLVKAVTSANQSDAVELALLLPEGGPPDQTKGIRKLFDETIEAPRSQAPQWIGLRKRFADTVRKAVGTCEPPEHPLSRILREHEVDVLFARQTFGNAFRVPLMCWIPDFQYEYFPDLFQESEVAYRRRNNEQMSRRAARVVVSSQAARMDFHKRFPRATDKCRVMHFVAQVPERVFEDDPAHICDVYRLPKTFFYLPNQFWKHKNHDVVLNALQIAAEDCRDMVVVCSGNVSDYRQPFHFSNLLRDISRKGLRDKFVVLGMVPRAHLYALLRQCIAVVQPSLFEGWSSTVEEAKSIGKRILLSDIPVHREQSPPHAIYFDPRDPQALADRMIRAYRDYPPGPDHDMEIGARAVLPDRLRAFGETFTLIAREAAVSCAPQGGPAN